MSTEVGGYGVPRQSRTRERVVDADADGDADGENCGFFSCLE